MAPAEAINVLTVGAVSEDLSPSGAPLPAMQTELTADDGAAPQFTSARGPGWAGALKPELNMPGGRSPVRIVPAGADLTVSSARNGRHGLVCASAGPGATRRRGVGTSHAAALTTRLALQAASALTAPEGPYAGQELGRRPLALLTRALLVNASAWPDNRQVFLDEAVGRGHVHHGHQKKDVAKIWGFGQVVPLRAVESPATGATFVAHGLVRNGRAQVFSVPLPPSLAGERVGRDLRVTVVWNSPVNPVSAAYRQAKLEVQADNGGGTQDKEWALGMKSDALDLEMVGKGTVWSHRLRPKRQTTTDFSGDAVMRIRVQGTGTVSRDEDIPFAIAVSYAVEVGTDLDILDELRNPIRGRTRV